MIERMGHGVRGKAHVGRIDGAIAEQVAVMMQALATPSRVLILARLRESPHAVGELAAAVGMELSAVSHQLRLLRQLGLVVGERHGRQIVYALHDSHVADLLDDAAYHLEHLLGAGTAQVARAQQAGAVLDRERPEQPDHRSLPTLLFSIHPHSR